MAEESKIARTFFGAEDNSAATIDKDKLNQYSDIAVRMFNTRVIGGKELVVTAVAQFASKVLGQIETLYSFRRHPLLCKRRSNVFGRIVFEESLRKRSEKDNVRFRDALYERDVFNNL